MDLEMVIVSEVSRKEQGKYHMIPLICGIQNDTNLFPRLTDLENKFMTTTEDRCGEGQG